MPKKNNQKPPRTQGRRRTRHVASVYETARALDTLKATPENQQTISLVGDLLAMWTRYAVEINPTAAGRLYLALCDSWQDNRNELYGDDNLSDPREQGTVMFHAALINRFRELFGQHSDVPVYEGDRKRARTLAAHMTANLDAMRERVGKASATKKDKDDGEYKMEVFASDNGRSLGIVTIRRGPVRAGKLAAVTEPDGMLIVRKIYYEPARGPHKFVRLISTLKGSAPQRFPIGDVEILGEIVDMGDAPPKAKPKETDDKPKTDETKTAHIEQLQQQITDLLNEGEAHNESGVFRLRREIYDLEHSSTEGVWPDLIPG